MLIFFNRKQVLTNDKNSLFKNLNLFSIEIELLQIYKGIYNESTMEFNYLTKLYTQTSESTTANEDERDDQCINKNQINSLDINQVYILIGNFNEGRLWLRDCDYLRRLDLMRSKDLIRLRNGIDCKADSNGKRILKN